MSFEIIDRTNWVRNAYFDHYFTNVPCTYSMSVKLDITSILQQHIKLYPAMLYSLSTIVNRHQEFRMDFDADGNLGVHGEMLPCYTVFHKDSETFSNIWTAYTPDFEGFLAAYTKDLQEYGTQTGMNAKPDAPANSFPVSMIPWTSFDGFQLNLQKGYGYLKPIFTMGKFVQKDDRTQLPLAIQVHHAVCDGFHVCRFVEELQELVHQL